MAYAKHRAPKGQAVKGAVKTTMEFTPEVYARIKRGAEAEERTPAVLLRRFIVANLDVLDPEGAESAEDSE
jgi:hypothetical protein